MLKHIRNIHYIKPQICSTKRRRKTDIQYKVFCNICNLGYTRKYDMEKHRRNKHPNANHLELTKQEDPHKETSNIIERKRLRRKKNEIIPKYYCDVCNKGFTRKYDMQKHRTVKHPDAPNSETSNKNQENSLLLKKCKVSSNDNRICYKCEICGKLFHHSYNFRRHQTIHTEIRPFFCHICGKNFRVLGGLQRHINEHHNGVKKYSCEICAKKFSAKSTRDDHLNIHTNTRPFVCDICGKAFRQKASLHVHKLFHTNVFRFNCNVCGKRFRRASELKVHGYLHTGYKPHKCGICGALFRLKQDLKRHAKVHVQCGKSFGQEKNLKNHIKENQEKCYEQGNNSVT